MLAETLRAHRYYRAIPGVPLNIWRQRNTALVAFEEESTPSSQFGLCILSPLGAGPNALLSKPTRCKHNSALALYR